MSATSERPPVWEDPRVRRGTAKQFETLDASGEKPAGWKLGLGSEHAMRVAATTGALLGHLPTATRLESGAEIDVAGWQGTAIEPELAIYLGADVPADADRDAARAAISALGIAFEIVDISLPLDRVEDYVALNVFHRFYMLGEPVPARAGGDTEGIRLEVLRDGEPLATIEDPEAAVGDLVDLTLHTARYLAAVDRALEAGQFIITGSLVPPIQSEPGERFDYRGGDLGELAVALR